MMQLSHTAIRGKQEYCSLGYPEDRIFVAPNAVAPRPAAIPVQRPQTYTDDRPTILFVGRLQARKRVDLLLRACAALGDTYRPRFMDRGRWPGPRWSGDAGSRNIPFRRVLWQCFMERTLINTIWVPIFLF